MRSRTKILTSSTYQALIKILSLRKARMRSSTKLKAQGTWINSSSLHHRTNLVKKLLKIWPQSDRTKFQEWKHPSSSKRWRTIGSDCITTSSSMASFLTRCRNSWSFVHHTSSITRRFWRSRSLSRRLKRCLNCVGLAKNYEAAQHYQNHAGL